jgi:hypothetical protein
MTSPDVVWAASGRSSFWPIFGWGVSLVIQGWKMSHPLRPFSEDEIQREMLR